jgi:hypothetical protein
MADIAGSYLAGIRSGHDLTSNLISGPMEEYQGAKRYQDAMKEKAQAHQDEADRLTYEADKTWKERADKQSNFDREQNEIEHHDKAMEDKPRPPRGGGAGMSPEQRLSIARRATIKQFMDADEKGETITPEMTAAYNDAIAGEHNYQTGGHPSRPKAGDDKPAVKEKGFLESAADAIHAGAEFFKDKPAPQTRAPAAPRMMNGKKIHEVSDGVWADDNGTVVWKKK